LCDKSFSTSNQLNQIPVLYVLFYAGDTEISDLA
jgi:hypothetical protein